MNSLQIETLFERLSKQADLPASFEDPLSDSSGTCAVQILESIEFLASDAARESMLLDPYWPKWNSPWWQMLLLFELGLAEKIPRVAAELICDLLDRHYLKFFPFKASEIPQGTDPYRHIACHCALGTMAQVLTASGINVEKKLPWIRPWFMKYQLEDGGLNCDEAVYSRLGGKSSVVSSVPVLEATLAISGPGLSAAEAEFSDRCADYLIRRKILCSTKTAKPIDESWLELCFPRFYHFDALRGLSVLLKWSKMRQKTVPLASIIDVVQSLEQRFPQGRVCVERNAWRGLASRAFDSRTQEWCRTESKSFPLLESVSKTGAYSASLSRTWMLAVQDILQLKDAGLIV